MTAKKPSVFLPAVLALLAIAPRTHADEKLILLGDVPRLGGRFEVTPDGSKLYFSAGTSYAVLDASGNVTDRIGAPGSARELVPLSDGWFIAANAHSAGQLALYRPDGSLAKILVGRGGNANTLRADGTGWTSPTGVAVDERKKRIFALDTTAPPAGFADPAWSRIAVFDFDGKYVNDIARWDGAKIKSDDPATANPLRTWYDDIEVDSARERVYVTTRRGSMLLAYGYDGKEIGSAPGTGGIAVFPDGRIAVGAADKASIQIYDENFKALQKLDVPTAQQLNRGITEGGMDLEADAQGRLYLLSRDPGTYFTRWNSDLKQPQEVGPRYLRMTVDWPDTGATAGAALDFKVTAAGRPQPDAAGAWQVLLRPSDGSDLRWQKLPATYRDGTLSAQAPANLKGIYEVAVRCGAGPIDRADWKNDPFLQHTFAFMPAGATRSLAVIPDLGRRAYAQGESIPLHIIRRDEGTAGPVEVAITANGSTLAKSTLNVGANAAVEISSAFTRRLPPGEYALRPTAPGHESYALGLSIVPAGPRSPLQRIAYHEFSGSPASVGQTDLADVSERMAFVRDYVDASRRLGFSRETDRRAWADRAWRRDSLPANAVANGFAPPEFYGIPNGGGWEGEEYLDNALRVGLDFDLQRMTHCSAVSFLPEDQLAHLPVLQRQAQFYGRYPSFYGYNYNDEMFFGGWDARLGDAPQKWLAAKTTELQAALPSTMPEADRKKRAAADAKLVALDAMYAAFNGATREANPNLKSTATPMWQFPAEEGSYAPVIYKGLDESYSHYLSEGYSLPWYPSHSAEFLRRPGKPLMGVFDNNYSGGGGDLYLKNWIQVAARGAQGIGVEHTPALTTSGGAYNDAPGASAYRVANRLAAMYGSIFAECPPANEGTILYSYTQDATETRNMTGTPAFERVFELHSLGLMAGVPMDISYEEDIANGVLLEGKKPRSPMLFLVGQTAKLPANVQTKIADYIAAGGKVFYDADSTPYPGGAKLDLQTHQLADAVRAGYAADTAHPLCQPILEASAKKLSTLLGAQRRYPLDTDDLWVSKNRLNGWGIQYLALATETGPFPWSAGEVWNSGAMYNKASFGAYLPKTVKFTFPFSGGVVYDVFNHEIVKPTVAGGKATIEADLTTFPGRVFAVAPAALGAPALRLQNRGSEAEYSVNIVDGAGRGISARVPLRIRLTSEGRVVNEYYRGTGVDGVWKETIALPLGTPQKLEVTELLGGKSSAVALTAPAAPPLLAARPDVEVQRSAQINSLLQKCGGTVSLAVANKTVLLAAQIDALSAALQKRGVTLQTGPLAAPMAGEARTVLACGVADNIGLMGDVILQSWVHGQFDQPLTPNVPGPGRGFVSATYAPRAYGENAVALVGGDTAGLQKTVDEFTRWLGAAPRKAAAVAVAVGTTATSGVPATAVVPRLSDETGVKLDSVTIAPGGKYLVVTSRGYQRNLALVEDGGASGKLVRAARVGQAPTDGSPFVAADGKSFGASARTLARWGEGFHLLDAASGKTDVFPAFGDIGRHTHRFAVSGDGNTVLAPGVYGVVCWKKTGGAWSEAWALDDWKRFGSLEWPISNEDERNPQFHAVIPDGADFALVMFQEKTDQGWIRPEHPGGVWLAALSLSDGKERWRFAVPVPKTLLFPKLYTSADGRRVLMQVQMGSWGTASYRFYSLDAATGKALGSWDGADVPAAAAIAEDGTVALAFSSRLLQVRRADGTLVWNTLWHTQPIGLAFGGPQLWLSDDAGRLTAFDADGAETAHAETGTVSAIAATPAAVYAAGWDGRLRAFDAAGKARWKLDLTAPLDDKDPMQVALDAAKFDPTHVFAAQRAATSTSAVPAGDDLLRNGKATLRVGGTGGWMSGGKVDVKVEDLTNGDTGDVATPWMNLDEVFWNGQTGRQVWAEIAFPTPTTVHSLTVYENPKFPASFPTDSVVQVWDEPQKQWQTAAVGTFLTGAVNTYALSLKDVSKIRYVPLGSYYRNFYTSEIEVR